MPVKHHSTSRHIFGAATPAGGWADETLSSRAWREDRRFLVAFVDMLFFWQKEHCKAAWHSEMKRLQLPPHMRDSTSYTARSA